MTRSTKKRFFCSKCGHTGLPSCKVCPNCGHIIAGSGRLQATSWTIIAIALFLLPAAALTYFHLFHPRVAVELSRLISPFPRHFLVGFDVSASIDQDALNKSRDVLAGRLMRFIGDETIFYQISTFGNPGCGKRSIARLVALPSPENHAAFDRNVRTKLISIAAVSVSARDLTPLTTPFYCFLETALAPGAGKRILIVSDLLNDDSDCREPFIFPAAAIERFGADKSNEIVFLYTRPGSSAAPELNQRRLADQKAFIDRMNAMADAGKIRVFFRPVPEEPLERQEAIRNAMRFALPATLGECILDRLIRIFYAISAVLFD